jgi:hypothetical protein
LLSGSCATPKPENQISVTTSITDDLIILVMFF